MIDHSYCKVLASEVILTAKWLRTWCVLLLGILSLSCPHGRNRQKVALASEGLKRWWLGHCRRCNDSQNKDQPLSPYSQRMASMSFCFQSNRVQAYIQSVSALQFTNLHNMRCCGLAIMSTPFGAEQAQVSLYPLPASYHPLQDSSTDCKFPPGKNTSWHPTWGSKTFMWIWIL